MIVVDTNLVATLLLDEPDRALAESVLARDASWCAPALLLSEFRNVVLHAVRRSELSPGAAEERCGRARALLAGRLHRAPDRAVLQLALASGCTAYDCEFVELAQRLGLPLITSDRDVLAAFPGTAIHPARFASGGFWGDRVSEAMAQWTAEDGGAADRRPPRETAGRRVKPTALSPTAASPSRRRGAARRAAPRSAA